MKKLLSFTALMAGLTYASSSLGCKAQDGESSGALDVPDSEYCEGYSFEGGYVRWECEFPLELFENELNGECPKTPPWVYAYTPEKESNEYCSFSTQ